MSCTAATRGVWFIDATIPFFAAADMKGAAPALAMFFHYTGFAPRAQLTFFTPNAKMNWHVQVWRFGNAYHALRSSHSSRQQHSRAPCPCTFQHADVMELVDMQDLGSCVARRVGSSPFIRTIRGLGHSWDGQAFFVPPWKRQTHGRSGRGCRSAEGMESLPDRTAQIKRYPITETNGKEQTTWRFSL